MNARYWLKMSHWSNDRDNIDRTFGLNQKQTLSGYIYYYLDQGYVVDSLKIIKG